MIRINLVPQRVTKKQLQLRQMAIAGGVVVVLTLGTIIGMSSHIGGKINKVEEDTKTAQASLKQLDSTVKKIEEFKKQKEELKKKLDVINELIENRSGPVRLMAELAASTPQRLWLNRVELKGGQLLLQGIADVESTVIDFTQRLKKQEHISDVEIKSLTGKEGTPPQGTLRGYILFDLVTTIRMSS